MLFNAPIHGDTMRIILPEPYRGLPLKAERYDENHPSYKNPMWPCILRGQSQLDAGKSKHDTQSVIEHPIR